MVPRRRTHPRVEPAALPLPAGRLAVRGPVSGERPQGQDRPRVRAPRHRGVRRRPGRDRRGGLRQGRPARRADAVRSPTPAPTSTPCTSCPPPGSATPGPGRPTARGPRWPQRRPARSPCTTRSSVSSRCVRGRARTASRRRPCCENETNTRRLYGVDTVTPYPRRDQRPRPGGAARRSGGAWHQVRVLAPADGASGETVEVRLRLRPADAPGPGAGRERTSTRWSRADGRRPTSSTPS